MAQQFDNGKLITIDVTATLTIVSISSKIGMFYDSVTGEAGMCTLATASSGVSIAKGNVVCVVQGEAVNDRYSLVPTTGNSNDMPSGVALTATSVAGGTFWKAFSGSVQVLTEGGYTPTRGYQIWTSSSVAGTVQQSATPGSVANHFKEVGHICSEGSGTGSQLVLCEIHFN